MNIFVEILHVERIRIGFLFTEEIVQAFDAENLILLLLYGYWNWTIKTIVAQIK